MSWIKKLFLAKKHEEKPNLSREEEMLVQLENSIAHCNQEILKANEETEQIKKWAAEAILDIFHIPNRLWYSELESYDEIKLLEENRSVDHKVVIKCDEVIAGYIEQVKLRVTKIALYKTLIEKYTITKVKMERIKKRSDDELAIQLKLKALEKHSQRIDQLRNSPENLNDHIEGSYQLEQLKNQARDVIEEFEISEEVKNSLDEINQQFNEGKYTLNTKSVIDEIEKLVEKIKKQD
jgi:hypothetical protein